MRDTDSWKLWLIVASTFLLLVGYQYWAVPETYVAQYGWAVVLKGATVAAFSQFITLLVPVAFVLVAGLIFDRVAPPKTGLTKHHVVPHADGNSAAGPANGLTP